MAQFFQFDPGQHVLNFRGIDLQAPMDGTFIKASRDVEAFKKSVGVRGDTTRVRNRNKGGTVMVTLQAASPSNDSLSAVAILDEQFGTGTGPLLIKDLLGNTVIEAEIAWIQKLPDVEVGDEASGREWTFDCHELDMFVGGSVVTG